MCARKHFEALGEDVVFMAPESSPNEFMEKTKSVLAIETQKESYKIGYLIDLGKSI